MGQYEADGAGVRPVVFLDIDGVLARYGDLALKLRRRRRAGAAQRPVRVSDRPFAPEAVQRLQRLLSTTGARVVVVSSWRRSMSPEAIADRLRAEGIEAPIECAPVSELGRAAEIRHWLATHPEVTRWCVLDDDRERCLGALHGSVVKPVPEVGLVDDDVVAAEGLLSRRTP